MSPAAYSHAAATLAYGLLAVTMLRALGPRQRSATVWALFIAVAGSCAWGASNLLATAGQSASATRWAGLLDLFRYSGLIAFALFVLGFAQRRPSAFLVVTATAAVLALGALASLLLGADEHLGWLGANAPLLSLAPPVVGMLLIEQLYRSSAEEGRWRIKPLCLGLAVVFAYDIFLHSGVLLFGRFDVDALTVRSAVHALGAPLLFIASRRQPDWNAPFKLSRNAAFHTATLMLVGVYLLFISAAGYYVRFAGGEWGRALEIVLLCLAVVGLAAVSLSTEARAKFRVFLGKHFFRYQYDYRHEWLTFTARLTQAKTPSEVGVSITRGLAQMLHSPRGALWYRGANGELLQPTSHWNGPRHSEAVAADSPFIAFMRQRDWVVDLDEYRRTPEPYEGAEVPEWLAGDERCWLVVPLMVDTDLYGFVVIDRPHAAQRLNWEVRDLLKTASRQAASYLALMHATDALYEARKFEAFNKMSAFVVHDLKNIVAQLSLMLQNAPKFKHNEEFQADMLATVENSLEKMKRLTLQLRSGETPIGSTVGVSLPAIAERLRAAAAARGRVLEVSAEAALATRGHADRLERVLGHIVDNALDATDASGKVRIEMMRERGRAKVVVSDTGHGMSPQFIAERLFRPFQSTKDHGMGIGSFESRQYVEQLGGEIVVDSQVGAGTAMTVWLPLMEAGNTLAREMSEVQ